MVAFFIQYYLVGHYTAVVSSVERLRLVTLEALFVKLCIIIGIDFAKLGSN